MRRTEFGRMLEEASRGARTKLLNRWSRVQIPAPAPIFVTAPTQNSPREPHSRPCVRGETRGSRHSRYSSRIPMATLQRDGDLSPQ